MDKKSQKSAKIVLQISILTGVAGAITGTILFKGPLVIGLFFGIILGFFLPWVVALISYAIYMISNPVAAFKDEIENLNKRKS